jgi:DNA-binding NarL/FixJ family response regulator
VRYTLQFGSLSQARSYFGVMTPTEAGVVSRAEQARRLKALGRSKAQIASELDVSLSTVKRYIRGQGGHQTFS